MKFDIEILSLPNEYKSFNLLKLANFVLNKEFIYGAFDNVEVSISFVSKKEIHKLNKEYRNIDNPTDVLSFEIDGYELHKVARNPKQDKWLNVSNLPVDMCNFQLGDIVICPEVAQENCSKFNTNIKYEITLLVVHGLLHLCGYDHIDKNDAQFMENREDQLISEWKNNV